MGAGPILPPPPPDEPWMQELSALPSSSEPNAQEGPSQTIANLPKLVGVIQIPGGASSAIFQVGDASSSAGVGESIGNSGWTLRSASGDGATPGQ